MDFLIPNFHKIFSQLLEDQKIVDIWFYYSSFLLVTIIVLTPQMWSAFRNVITVAHEGSHALIGFLMGRGVKSIKLNHDTSGYTVSEGSSKSIGLLFTTLAGYIGPSLFAIAISVGLYFRKASLSVTIIGLLLFIMFLFIRNIWGFIVVITLLFYFYVIIVSNNEVLQSSSLLVLMWLAAIGGFKSTVELRMLRKQGQGSGSDSEALRQMTFIPAIIWEYFFIVFTLASIFVVFFFSQAPYGILKV